MRLSIAAFAVGLGLLMVGLWLAWPPLSLIAPGAVLVAWSLLRRTDAAAR